MAEKKEPERTIKDIIEDVSDLSSVIQSQFEKIQKSVKDMGPSFGIISDQTQRMADHLEASEKALNLISGLDKQIKLRNEEIDALMLKANDLENKNSTAQLIGISAIQEKVKILQQVVDEATKLSELEKANYERVKKEQAIYESLLKPLIGESKEYEKIQKLVKGILTGGFKMWVAIISASFDRFIELDKAAGAFRQKTGLIATQMGVIRSAVEFTNTEMAKLGVTMEKAYGVASSLYETFETTVFVTKDVIMFSAQL